MLGKDDMVTTVEKAASVGFFASIVSASAVLATKFMSNENRSVVDNHYSLATYGMVGSALGSFLWFRYRN